jgi:transposase
LRWPLAKTVPNLSKARAKLEWVYGTVTMKSPLQMRFEFALCTRDMVRGLIRDRCGVRLSGVSVERLLGKLGLSPQRASSGAYQHDPQKVQTWLREEFPAIQKQAKRLGAPLFFGEEANVRSDYHSGTTRAPVGQTPVLTRTGARHTLNMISAISPRGELHFMCHEGKFNAALFIEFLQRLLNNRLDRVLLIVDGHPVHRSAGIKRFVADNHKRIRLFRLPSYRPELNPDELVCSHVKHHQIGKTAIIGPDPMNKHVIAFLRSLQKTPALIRALFQRPTLCYAA